MVSVSFTVTDYILMSLTMVASIAIGVYYRFTGGKQKTTEEYLLADRNMSVIPVAFSLMASFMSAITLLGVAMENYTYGIQFVVINISYLISTPIAAYMYLPVFFRLQKTSAYEYLGLRFGPRLRLLASMSYSLQMILYNGIVLYAPALTLEAVTGLNKTISILLIGLVCTFYSTIGGMKAVLMTDLFQSMIMYAAVWSIIIFAAIRVGGLDSIWSIADDNGRISFNNFSIDPTERHTWWNLIIGGSVTYLSLYAVNHTQVQRLLTVKTLKQSQTCLWITWPILSFLSLSTCFSGLAIFSAYYDCDPVKNGSINAGDQLMPYYVMDQMKGVPGLSGLFIAGIFSASLSTISAACNSLAAVTMRDYIPFFEKRLKIRSITGPFAAKFCALFYGLLFLALAFLAEYLGGVLQSALTIFGAVGGPLLGVFTLGMFTTYAHEFGAMLGLLTGMSTSLWMSFGQPRPPLKTLPVSIEGCPNGAFLNATTTTAPAMVDDDQYFYLYRMSYMWVGVMGFLITFLIGILFSFILPCKQPWEREDKSAGNKSSDKPTSLPDPALFTPLLASIVRKRNDKIIQGRMLQMEESTRF